MVWQGCVLNFLFRERFSPLHSTYTHTRVDTCRDHKRALDLPVLAFLGSFEIFDTDVGGSKASPPKELAEPSLLLWNFSCWKAVVTLSRRISVAHDYCGKGEEKAKVHHCWRVCSTFLVTKSGHHPSKHFFQQSILQLGKLRPRGTKRTSMLRIGPKPWVMAISAILNPFGCAGPTISLLNKVKRNEKP